MKTTNFSRMMSLVLVFAMLATMFVFNAGAAATFDESGENLLTYVIEGDTVTILKCSDKATGEVVIPAEIDGKAVTKIDKNAFEGCKSITSLVIPEGVTVIGGETVVPELTIDDYADLFVKSGLIFHLNFADAETGAVPGSDKYEDETALAAERFVTPNTFWNNYIVDAVSNGDYFKGGAATVEKGGWKFLSPYRYAYWYNADDSLAHTAGSTNTFDNFVTEPGLTDEETGDLLYPYYVVNGEYKTTESAREIGGVKKPLYTLIHTAPESATGYYISAGVWGKTIYSDAMGDGYLANGKGGAFYYSGSNLAAVQTSKEYTVNLTVKSADSNVSAYKLYYGGRSGMRFDHAAGTVTFVPENNDGALHNTASALVNRKMNGIKTNGVIAYTFTVDAKNIANNEATLGFYINGRSDFDGAEATQTITTPVKTIPGTSEYHISGEKVQTYAIRVYDKVLTEQEVLQNNFADIATIAELDITEFIKLSDTEKQKVYEAFEGKQADDGKATLQLLLDVATGAYVEAVEYDYYDLFVSDGLLYHMNFASATDDMAINPANPNAEFAVQKFGAHADTYDPFVVYAKEGITGKMWAGGTATIAEGGWKFTTPYRYSYWFNDADQKLNHTGGGRGKVSFFVSETGLTQVPKIDASGNEIEGEYEAVNYYPSFEEPGVNETNTYGGVSATTYRLMHTAPAWATGFYIADGVWGGPNYSSAFGNGYFDAAKGNSISLYNGVYDLLKSANAVSLELVAASTKNQRAAFFIGPRFEFTPKDTGVVFTGTAGNDLLAADSGYQTIQMALNGQKVNTYSFTFDLEDIANKNYTLNAYGNGKNYSTQELKSQTNTFSATSYGQYLMRGDGLYTYAVRVYEKELSANEVLCNRFADIVTIKALDLDIGAFLALDAADKLTVYSAFEGYTPDDDKATLQGVLDTALEAVAEEEVAEETTMFADCAALASVTVFAETAPALIADAFKDAAALEEIIVPAASVDAYKAADGWSDYADLIVEYVPPVTEPPVTEPPVTEPPVTEPPVTEPPVTEPPATEPPAPMEVPYKADINYELADADGDGVYTADDIFGAANTYEFVEKGAGWSVGVTEAADKVNKIDTTISYAWDGEYIYFYIVAKDSTFFVDAGLGVMDDPNKNWSYDGIELWYYLGGEPSKKADVRQFWASRYGHALNAQTQVKSNFFDSIAWDCEINTETNTSYITFKLPAKAENGTALVGGDIFYTALQIDDNRNAENTAYYCTTGNSGDLANYDKFVLAEVTAPSIMYGDVNGDGEVLSTDVLMLRKYIANLDYDTGVSTIEVKPGADVNGDGEILSTDVLMLRKYIANLDYDTGESTIVLGPRN